MAILLASGLAVATTNKVNTPNVKWAGTHWEAFSGSYTCTGNESFCVGYAERDAENNIVSVTDIQPGTFSPL